MENTMPKHRVSQFLGGSNPLIQQPNSHRPNAQHETTDQGSRSSAVSMTSSYEYKYSCPKDSKLRSSRLDICSSSSGHDFRQRYHRRPGVAGQHPEIASSEQKICLPDPPDKPYDEGNELSQDRPTAANPFTGLPLDIGTTTITTSAESPASELRAETLSSKHDEARPRGPTVKRESSLAIVPYTGGRHQQAICETPGLRCRLFNLTPSDQRGVRFSPASRPVAASTTDALGGGGREVSSDLAAISSLKRGFNSSNTSSPGQEGRPEWVVMTAEQAEHAARKLRGETEKNKTLQARLERHKHDRVLIYDAAMKQAAEREEEGVKEAKRTFEREKTVMRAEVDHELLRINDLYEKRCRDYAQMVSDDGEEEISKASAELRKGWAREKKTIAQLVREGAEEDRQVAVIARAVMEHLQEEKKDEVTALRAEIYAEVKLEFENREMSLRDALQSEFQADLDGQLLLAEIRHQKEMDQLRMELRDCHAPSARKAGESIVVYNRGTTPKRNSGEGSPRDPDPDPDPNSSTRSPSLPRRSLQQKIPFRGAGNGGNDSGVARAAAVRGKSGLVKKLPTFRTPAQKAPANSDTKTTDMESGRSSEPTAQRRPRIKSPSLSPKTGNISSASPKPLDYVRQRHKDEEFDGSITSALMVSPTKTSGIAVTPSMGVEDTLVEKASTHGAQRPKKRGKRLFTAHT